MNTNMHTINTKTRLLQCCNHVMLQQSYAYRSQNNSLSKCTCKNNFVYTAINYVTV